LRHRVDERPERFEQINYGRAAPVEYEEIKVADELGTPGIEVPRQQDDLVVYRPGMKMADVERAAIEAALRESKGNRRKAAQQLGIAERTLYRRIKDHELE